MKHTTFFVPLLFLLTFLFLAFSRVTTVTCVVAAQPCPQDLQERANKIKNLSFFFGDFEKKLLENQNSNTTYILENITKIFPGTIQLTFKQEAVQYSLMIAETTKNIGTTGVVLPEQSQASKTNITWANEALIIEENKVLLPYHAIFLSIAQNIAHSPNKNPKITWNSDQEIFLKYEGEPLFIFDMQSVQTQIKKVDTIISARELDEIEEPILEIDMRFDLPVLRTRQ